MNIDESGFTELDEKISDLLDKILDNLPFESKMPLVCPDEIIEQEVKELVDPVLDPLKMNAPVDETQSVFNSTFNDMASTSGSQGTLKMC